ncbi:hypothetical protein FGB62_69g114 [Gracilaria domingensis]|nr:hypothetical protein FGB62_69g114 [Gracilaria domingensis]
MGLLELFKPLLPGDDGPEFRSVFGSSDEPRRPSRAQLFRMICDLDTPLHLSDPIDVDQCSFLQLVFNAFAMEFRDMFRMIEGLLHHAHERSIEMDHLSVFYSWFEGFFEILTSVFDTEENVFYPWIETQGFFKMENAFCDKRRQKKKDRAKEICWDILELKLHFGTKADRKRGLFDLVYELRDEAEHLTARVMVYLHSEMDEVSRILKIKFNDDERRLFENTMVQTYRSSEAGHFVLCAMSRGIPDESIRNGFLEENFRSSGQKVPKQLRKFRKRHSDLVEKLAIRDLRV